MARIIYELDGNELELEAAPLDLDPEEHVGLPAIRPAHWIRAALNGEAIDVERAKAMVEEWRPQIIEQARAKSSASDEWDQAFRDTGYEFCRPCGEWHRPPECAIDEGGNAINPFTGKSWDEPWGAE